MPGPSRDAYPVTDLNHAFPAVDAPVSAATPRASACPGLVRIVAARDGGLCRIRLPGGALSADAADAIADAALAHASGVIEATNRANLQIRGVRAGEQQALIARLLAAGLGPAGVAGVAGVASAADTALAQPANPAADDVRNLMLSPAAGRDPAALIDTQPLAEDILTLLRSEARFAALSPKFALQLDGGERLTMLGHPHDIWLAALPCEDGPRLAFGLAGTIPVAPHQQTALAAVRPAQVPALVRALLDTFIELATPEMTRMRDLLAQHPAEALLERAAARLDFALLRGPQIAAWRRTPADAALRFGVQPQRESASEAGRLSEHPSGHLPGRPFTHASGASRALSQVGGQPPLGRLDAATLRELATLAREAGNGTLRITPWQSVLLPDVPENHAQSALARLAALGFACERAQPFARLIACAGSSGCAKGLADTKADAAQLARSLPAAAEVHLSGCVRSCAAAHPVPFTLLAVAPGRYDLYQRTEPLADPRTGAPLPQATRSFGTCVACNLTIDEAAPLLQPRPARSFPDA
ncbi:precorrin-3B synthase [Paraburkholderia jirisanensis]